MMQARSTTRIIFALILAVFTFTGLAQAQSPPTIAKDFSSATVSLNNSVTLTFTLTNPNPATDLTGVSFSDDMPAGLLIANPDSLGGTCDTSVVTLTPTNISLVGATLLANSSCTLSIDTLATTSGDQVNTTNPITSVEGGTGGTATATVTVVVPDLTITKTHTGNFVRPQTGATYTITVSNSGGADTSALITVNDTLPAGLTATDFSGTNWNCTLSPLQCTRGDVLFAGTSFEPITLTVNVAVNAPSSVTNTATVSGGAETNTANDSASDVTQIDAALVMSAQTANLTVAAGSTASTTLNVNYNGGLLGAVTFACSGLPAASSCAFNPPSVSASGTTPVTLTISTTARSSALPWPNGVPPQFMLFVGLLGLTAMALTLVRQKNAKIRLAMASTGLALLLLAGCSVAPAAPSPTPTPVRQSVGTPAGTSAITVTATSATGGATATSTVNLTVQ